MHVIYTLPCPLRPFPLNFCVFRVFFVYVLVCFVVFFWVPTTLGGNFWHIFFRWWRDQSKVKKNGALITRYRYSLGLGIWQVIVTWRQARANRLLIRHVRPKSRGYSCSQWEGRQEGRNAKNWRSRVGNFTTECKALGDVSGFWVFGDK